MFLKVLKAMFTDNEQKLPDHWPIEASPIQEDEKVSPPWLTLTVEELDKLRDAHKEEYREWANEYRKKREEREAEFEAIRPENTCKNKLKELGFDDDEIHCILKWKKFDA
jgi:hypothetical protein